MGPQLDSNSTLAKFCGGPRRRAEGGEMFRYIVERIYEAGGAGRTARPEAVEAFSNAGSRRTSGVLIPDFGLDREKPVIFIKDIDLGADEFLSFFFDVGVLGIVPAGEAKSVFFQTVF